MKKLLAIIPFLTAATCLAQSDIERQASSAASLIEQAQKADNDSLRSIYAAQAVETFEAAITQDDAMTVAFGDIKPISVLATVDNKLRIFSWGIQNSEGKYSYYGFVQAKSQDGETVTTRLVDKKDETPRPGETEMEAANWYGAIYYEMVQLGGKKSNIYAMAGWDGGDLFINRKVLEQIRVKDNGTVYFGGYFTDEHKRTCERLIFEFTERAVMCLRFDKRLKMFVADHMTIPPEYNGNPKFRGPDGSFDGYMYQKGNWIYVPDLDFKGSRF